MRAYIREDDFARFLLVGEDGNVIANSYNVDDLVDWAQQNGHRIDQTINGAHDVNDTPA